MLRYAHPNLGRLAQPRDCGMIHKTAAAGIPWAADNDAYSNFDRSRYERMIERLAGLPGCLFVTAPDVVCDAERTAELFDEWQPVLADYGLPVGLVAQNGQTDPPWDRIDGLFLGGDNAFKLGPEGERWAVEAKARGKWLHMGRVNTNGRIAYAATLNCDSVDGSQWARWKSIYLLSGLTAVSQPRQDRLL